MNKQVTMIRAVIFDLDGLLTDTELLHSRAWRKTFQERGIHISERQYADHWVRQGKGFFSFLAERDLKLKPEELQHRKDQIFAQLVQKGLRALPGALELLEALHGRVKLALASSARRIPVDLVLRTLGVTDYFEVIATFEDVSQAKPEPDVFLLAAKRLGVEPSECVVIEDAEKGIIAAHRAGMKSIVIPNHHTRDNDFSKATLMVNSLHEVTLERITAL